MARRLAPVFTSTLQGSALAFATMDVLTAILSEPFPGSFPLVIGDASFAMSLFIFSPSFASPCPLDSGVCTGKAKYDRGWLEDE